MEGAGGTSCSYHGKFYKSTENNPKLSTGIGHVCNVPIRHHQVAKFVVEEDEDEHLGILDEHVIYFERRISLRFAENRMRRRLWRASANSSVGFEGYKDGHGFKLQVMRL